MNGHSLASVLGTRLSPLLAGLGPPRARPRPGPRRELPSPHQFRTDHEQASNLGLAEELENRHRRRIAAWARRTQLSTRTPPFPVAAGTSAVQETRIRLPRQDTTTMSEPGRPARGHPAPTSRPPPGRPRHHWAPTAPHWRAPGNRQVTHQIPAGTKQTTSRPAGRKYLSNYPSDLSACPVPTTPKIPEFRTRTSISRTGQTRISKLDGMFHGRHRRLKTLNLHEICTPQQL
jgi:hypothetical protein